MERKKWSASEEKELLSLIESHNYSLNSCFRMVSATTGRSVKAIASHYYNQMRSHTLPDSHEGMPAYNGRRKWTEEENQTLIEYIKPNTGNLHACFLHIAEETGRTPLGVAHHWYKYLSRRPDVKVLVTASENSVQVNRKNGAGRPSEPSMWRRLLKLLGL